MSSAFYTVKEVMQELKLSESGAYKVICNLNEELRKKGFCTLRGKVPAKYLKERFGIQEEAS